MSLKVDYDAIVVGAGFAGLALIHHLRELGISLKVFDKASDIGTMLFFVLLSEYVPHEPAS